MCSGITAYDALSISFRYSQKKFTHELWNWIRSRKASRLDPEQSGQLRRRYFSLAGRSQRIPNGGSFPLARHSRRLVNPPTSVKFLPPEQRNATTMKTNSRILPTSITVPLIYKQKLLSYLGCTHRKCFIRRHVVSLRAKELNLLLFIDAPTCHILEILEGQVLPCFS